MDHKGYAQLEKAKKVVATLYTQVAPHLQVRPVYLTMMLRQSLTWRAQVEDAADVTPLSEETVDLAVDLAEWVATLPAVDSTWTTPE